MDTVIVGAGHAGLAMSRCLAERSIDHVLLERGEVAHSWRTERWDSLRLLTPNWQSRLPGFRYEGDDPDGYRTLPEAIEFIANYAELSRGLDAVMHGFFVGGTLRGVAELRPLGEGFAHEAEAAFSIEKPWQSNGVGSALLERTLLAARNRGIKLLHMACLANNKRMVDLAKKFDAELSFDFGSVVGEVEAPHPTPMSMWREVVADTHGFATAMLDVQTKLLRTA